MLVARLPSGARGVAAGPIWVADGSTLTLDGGAGYGALGWRYAWGPLVAAGADGYIGCDCDGG